MALAPFCLATRGIKLAGDTAKELPTIKKQSHSLQAFIAPSNTPFGNNSPNKTTLGLIKTRAILFPTNINEKFHELFLYTTNLGKR